MKATLAMEIGAMEIVKGSYWLIAALRFYKQDLGFYRNDFVSER
jgi:hypothetical protein